MNSLTAQIVKDLVIEATEEDIKITRNLGDLVFFTVKGEQYTCELTRTGKVKKNSANLYDSYS